MAHKCERICYLSGYNVCIDCGVVQKDLIFGNEYIEQSECYDEPVSKNIKQINIPRKVMIFKEINKFKHFKMSRALSKQLDLLSDIQRSSKMIAIGYIVHKNIIDIDIVSKETNVAKGIIKKIISEIKAELI